MVLSERMAVILFALTLIAGLPASILISRVIVG
jgi:hypothetical protein